MLRVATKAAAEAWYVRRNTRPSGTSARTTPTASGSSRRADSPAPGRAPGHRVHDLKRTWLLPGGLRAHDDWTSVLVVACRLDRVSERYRARGAGHTPPDSPACEPRDRRGVDSGRGLSHTGHVSRNRDTVPGRAAGVPGERHFDRRAPGRYGELRMRRHFMLAPAAARFISQPRQKLGAVVLAVPAVPGTAGADGPPGLAARCSLPPS